MANKAQTDIVFSKHSEALLEKKYLFNDAITLHYVTSLKKVFAYPYLYWQEKRRAFQVSLYLKDHLGYIIDW